MTMDLSEPERLVEGPYGRGGDGPGVYRFSSGCRQSAALRSAARARGADVGGNGGASDEWGPASWGCPV